MSIVNDQGSTIYVTGVQTTSTMVTGLTEDTSYTFSVQGRNAAGLSPGTEVTIRTFETIPPSAPVLLKDVPSITNAKQIGLSW